MQCVVETITFSSYSNHKFSVSSTNLWYPSPPQAQASLSPPHSASLVSSSSRTASTFGRVTKCRSNCAQTAHSSCKYAICTSPANIRYAHWLPIELRRLDATSWPEYTSNKAQIAKTNFVQMVEYWQAGGAVDVLAGAQCGVGLTGTGFSAVEGVPVVVMEARKCSKWSGSLWGATTMSQFSLSSTHLLLSFFRISPEQYLNYNSPSQTIFLTSQNVSTWITFYPTCCM